MTERQKLIPDSIAFNIYVNLISRYHMMSDTVEFLTLIILTKIHTALLLGMEYEG